jgi:membrane protease YdiL (CAAX protease family)
MPMTSFAQPHMALRNRATVEVFAGLLLIFGYTWLVHTRYPSWLHVAFFVCIAALIIFSKQSRKESFHDLGFRLDNFQSSLRLHFLPAASATVILCLVWSRFFTLDSEFYLKAKFWEKLITYPLWALFQQYIALAFFFRRLKDIFFPSILPAVLCSGVIFSASHIPNPPLMIFTFLGGLFWAWAYDRRANLFTIALSHGIIGTILTNFLLVYPIVGPFADIARWSQINPAAYSLDSINGTTPSGKSRKIDVEKQEKAMIVQGWAKGVEGDVEKMFIHFKGRDYPVEYGRERRDVARVYASDDYLYTGFRANIPVSHLVPGTYPLRVKIKLSNKSTFHYPGNRVWIRIR